MFFIVLLCSFFIQINASDIVISVGEFFRGFPKRFTQEPFEYKPLDHAPSKNLVIVHLQNFAESEVVRTIIVDDPYKILMNGAIFPPEEKWDTQTIPCGIEMRKASKSTRPVGIYSGKDWKVCLKKWPEVPIMETFAYEMYKAMFQNGDLPYQGELPLPASEMIVMNDQVFLVSEYIEGESLYDIFNRVKKSPDAARGYVFNLKRFQQLVIFCLAAAPEDFHPSNCIVRQIKGSNEYELVLIDYDRIFGKIVTDTFARSDGGIVSTRTHCVMFCFLRMLQERVVESIFEEITLDIFASNIRKFVERVSRACKYQERLAGIVKDADAKKTLLELPLGVNAIDDIAMRFNGLKDAAVRFRDQSLANIIARVFPAIADIYKCHEYVATPEPMLVEVLRRIQEKDGRRYSGSTPPSAEAPLPVYFGSSTRNFSLSGNLTALPDSPSLRAKSTSTATPPEASSPSLPPLASGMPIISSRATSLDSVPPPPPGSTPPSILSLGPPRVFSQEFTTKSSSRISTPPITPPRQLRATVVSRANSPMVPRSVFFPLPSISKGSYSGLYSSSTSPPGSTPPSSTSTPRNHEAILDMLTCRLVGMID